MVLHEYYFGNMTKNARRPAPRRACKTPSAGDVRRLRHLEEGLQRVGGMRGVGWAIAYLRPARARVSNHWITLHEDGNVAGFVPLLVMDVWEHAFLLDYKPAERSKYIEAFFANVDWNVVQQRLDAAKGGS